MKLIELNETIRPREWNDRTCKVLSKTAKTLLLSISFSSLSFSLSLSLLPLSHSLRLSVSLSLGAREQETLALIKICCKFQMNWKTTYKDETWNDDPPGRCIKQIFVIKKKIIRKSWLIIISLNFKMLQFRNYFIAFFTFSSFSSHTMLFTF